MVVDNFLPKFQLHMMPPSTYVSVRSLAAAVVCVLLGSMAHSAEECSSPQKETFSYANVFAAERSTSINFSHLPGFTRSVYERDHALVTPESRVWAGNPAWNNTLTAHIVSRVIGANFAFYLADMKPGSNSLSCMPGVERFILVLRGKIEIWAETGPSTLLDENDFAYFPPDSNGRIESLEGAGILVYERMYALDGSPKFFHGNTEEQKLLPVDGEVFRLRKLLPATTDYDFNVHVMDFSPGEYLNVKEVHYNQHGLLMLDGQGIYRLGNSWYPVQAGDAIWMGPYVPQWYAALGPNPTRYVIYKDTSLDPLMDH